LKPYFFTWPPLKSHQPPLPHKKWTVPYTSRIRQNIYNLYNLHIFPGFKSFWFNCLKGASFICFALLFLPKFGILSYTSLQLPSLPLLWPILWLFHMLKWQFCCPSVYCELKKHTFRAELPRIAHFKPSLLVETTFSREILTFWWLQHM